MIKELIQEFDQESKDFYNYLSLGDEPRWNESMKKLKVVFKKILIEMDSLDYPSMETIEKLAEINRMMGDIPDETKFYNQLRGVKVWT